MERGARQTSRCITQPPSHCRDFQNIIFLKNLLFGRFSLVFLCVVARHLVNLGYNKTKPGTVSQEVLKRLSMGEQRLNHGWFVLQPFFGTVPYPPARLWSLRCIGFGDVCSEIRADCIGCLCKLSLFVNENIWPNRFILHFVGPNHFVIFLLFVFKFSGSTSLLSLTSFNDKI